MSDESSRDWEESRDFTQGELDATYYASNESVSQEGSKGATSLKSTTQREKESGSLMDIKSI